MTEPRRVLNWKHLDPKSELPMLLALAAASDSGESWYSVSGDGKRFPHSYNLVVPVSRAQMTAFLKGQDVTLGTDQHPPVQSHIYPKGKGPMITRVSLAAAGGGEPHRGEDVIIQAEQNAEIFLQLAKELQNYDWKRQGGAPIVIQLKTGTSPYNEAYMQRFHRALSEQGIDFELGGEYRLNKRGVRPLTIPGESVAALRECVQLIQRTAPSQEAAR